MVPPQDVQTSKFKKCQLFTYLTFNIEQGTNDKLSRKGKNTEADSHCCVTAALKSSWGFPVRSPSREGKEHLECRCTCRSGFFVHSSLFLSSTPCIHPATNKTLLMSPQEMTASETELSSETASLLLFKTYTISVHFIPINWFITMMIFKISWIFFAFTFYLFIILFLASLSLFEMCLCTG